MTKKETFISIGFKMITIVSLILGLSLGGLTLLSTWFFGTDIERTIKINTMDRVELLSRNIESDLRANINTSSLIAATMEGGFIYQGTGSAATNALLAQNETILTVWIVSKSNNVLKVVNTAEESSRITKLGISVPAQTEILTSYNDSFIQSFFGSTILHNFSPEFNYPVLGLSFPYSKINNQEAESIVIMCMLMKPLIATLSARDLYINYLIDSKGVLLAHPDENLAGARPSFRSEEIVRDSMVSNVQLKQMQFRDSNNDVFIGSYQRFMNGSITVISVVKKETALAGVYNLQWRNLLITIIILCSSMFLLFFFSKSLTDPIKTLVEGASHIKNGDFSFHIIPSSNDEIGHLALSFNSMTKGLMERDKIKTAFSKFVNKEIAERVLKEELQLGGVSRKVAVFFSDIRSFTAISEKLTPQEVVEFLNEYMTVMVKCIDQTNGVVDKFIGDSIMAIWGIPESRGNDTEQAINAALLMRLALVEFNKTREGDKKPKIKIGCGINSGDIIAGQIGSPERMEYTCIGDAVNLASRIESLNKVFHTDILISERALAHVRTIFLVVPMKKIKVKGKEGVQQIYAVLGRYDDPNHFRSIDKLRAYLGIDSISLEHVDPDIEELKYEIIE